MDPERPMKSSTQNGVTNTGFVMDEVVSNGQSEAAGDKENNFVATKSEEITSEAHSSCKNYFITAKWLLVVLCFTSLIQGVIVNGLINVVLSTLEKRFKLASTQTGIISASYDIGSMLCVIPISYFGGRLGSSKPRYIALGLAVMGFGSLLFTMPHFFSERYLDDYLSATSINSINTLSNGTLCSSSYTEEDCSSSDDAFKTLQNFRYFFIFGQILHGMGAAPLITLGNTLIDESVGKKLAPLYIGIFSTFFIVGPAVGFIFGGLLLSINTDFYSTSPEDIIQIPKTLRIGSWWLGFIVAAIFSWIVAILIAQFPATLPGSSHHNTVDSKVGKKFTKLKNLPKALKDLFINPTFMCLSVGGAIDGFWISGITTFLPKFIESQYFLTPSLSATLVGIVAVPCGGLGTFIGGWIAKKMKLNRGGIIKLYIICQVVSFPVGFCFLLSCNNISFAGITAPYLNSINSSGSSAIDANCNSDCSCSSVKYDPVCGVDGLTYYNPCYAGCTSSLNSTYFEECRCILGEGIAYKTDNVCGENQSCTYLPYFILLVGVNIFATFMSSMTTIVATLRAVEPVHRSLALGFAIIVLRLLGNIPGPITFGLSIDSQCLFWQSGGCEGKGGNCLIYENFNMATRILALYIVFKLLGIISYATALFFSKRSKISEDENTKE